MIHEYAVAPELVATWIDRRSGRYFIDKFGLGSPRIISRYPGRWKRLAWEAFRRESQLDETRMVELLARLSDTMVKRVGTVWKSDRSWTENAIEENRRIPFHAILAAEDAVQDPSVLVAEGLDEKTPLWSNPTGLTVPRQVERIAEVMRDMLRVATDIVFVDPYFTPHRSGYVRAIETYVRASGERRAVGRARIRIFSGVDARGENRKHFEEGCCKHLPRKLPKGQKVTIDRLSERTPGEKLHNRYILTEHGGVQFGAGLDEMGGGASDDLSLLDREPYRSRWKQYASDQPAFDRPEPEITVQGTGRSPGGHPGTLGASGGDGVASVS